MRFLVFHVKPGVMCSPDNLAYVGGNEVANELFHVVVDGSALLNSRHNGGEVVISQDHLRG